MSKVKNGHLAIKTPRDERVLTSLTPRRNRSVSPAPFIVTHDTFIKNTDMSGVVKNGLEETRISRSEPIKTYDNHIGTNAGFNLASPLEG